MGGLAMWWLCDSSNAVAQPIAMAGQTVALGAGVTSVTLQPKGGTELDSIFREAGRRRFTLSLTGITASRSPEASYLVFLNVKDANDLTVDNLGYAGSLAFFGGARTGAWLRFPPVSFEISEVLVRLRQANRSASPLVVTFKPTGTPTTGSAPSIENIGLFAF